MKNLNLKSVLALCAILISFVMCDHLFGHGTTATMAGTTMAGVFPTGAGHRMREVFKKYNDMYNPIIGKDPVTGKIKRKQNFILEPSYMRLEWIFSNTKSSYTLSPAKQLNTDSVTEQKIDRNDLFIGVSLSAFIAKVTRVSPAKHILQTYPNATIFGATEAAELATLYNGRLQFKVGTKVNCEAIDMANFLHIPETQQSSATNYSAYSLTGTEFVLPSEWRFRGDANNSLEVSIDPYPGIIWESLQATYPGTDNKGILKIQGFLVKNFCTSQSITDSLEGN
jgi:hypothetical protein